MSQIFVTKFALGEKVNLITDKLLLAENVTVKGIFITSEIVHDSIKDENRCRNIIRYELMEYPGRFYEIMLHKKASNINDLTEIKK